MMITIADAVQMSSTSAPRVRLLDAARDRAHRGVVRAHHARAAIAHHARDATVAVMRRKLKMNRLWIHSEPLLMIERDHADLGKGEINLKTFCLNFPIRKIDPKVKAQVQAHHLTRLLTRQNARVAVIEGTVRFLTFLQFRNYQK